MVLKKSGVKIVTILIIAFVIGFIAYSCFDYFMGKSVVKSNPEFFELTLPGKFNFKKNKNADEKYVLSQFDSSNSLFIFALAYENDKIENFKDYVEYSHEYYKSGEGINEVTDLSEVEKFAISDYDSYKYSYVYVDENNEEFYLQQYLINCKNGYYVLNFEAPKDQQDKYKSEFDKIAKTFKELG